MGTTSYTFHGCLGRGGFGEVYLATRRSPDGLERKVAVKVLRQDLPQAEAALARLRDEARMMAMLDHPAIVGVVELTRLDGRIALVTDYVEGTDLSRFCAPTRLLPARVVCEVVAEVAGALCVAIDTPSPDTGRPLRLVHRDIKPENLRLGRHGEVKLLDFGIARSTELSREARTATGTIPFTLGYTAPETFLELTQHPPSDVFALGASFFRLLTADRFYGSLSLGDQAALCGDPERFGDWVEDRCLRLGSAPESVRELVAAMLAHAPGARPTASEVQQRLEGLLSELPGPTLKRWARENLQELDRPLEEGPLVGKVLDPRTDESTAFPRRHPPAPPPAPAELVGLRPELRESSTDGRPSQPPAKSPVVSAPPTSRPPTHPPARSAAPVLLGALAAGLLLAALLAAGASALLTAWWMWG